ncbi:uncharacterized protein TNCV_2368521 [Trichonephila clavipes]|nr:uncharacterized protein TNCV_2368521 [Trichonephila clavipes]
MLKSSISFYRHFGRWSSTLVSCPECWEPMTVRHIYSEHASQKHNLDCRKQSMFCFGRTKWPYGQKNLPERKHVTAYLQRFLKDVKEEMEIEEEETVEEEVCGCKDFQPMPREMQGRRKDRLSEYVGFYDSLFEKPEMSEEGIELQAALGKDVWGSVERYLRQYLVWFHIMIRREMYVWSRKQQNIMNEIKKGKIRVGLGPKGDIKVQFQRDESKKRPDSKVKGPIEAGK